MSKDNIVILSPGSNTYFKVESWTKRLHDKNIYIIINKRHENDYIHNKPCNVHIFTVAKWDENEVYKRIQEINKRESIDLIFSYLEEDVILAAKIRERLNIEGQSLISAKSFRDKVIMKDIVKAAGYRVPKYFKVIDYEDFEQFAKENKYRIVLKPTDKAGAEGVFVIRTKDEYEKIREHQNNIIKNEYMCEEYIPHNIYHIDGLVINNKVKYIFVWEYLKNCINFKNEKRGSTISKTVMAGTDTYDKLQNYARKVIEEFDTPDNYLFHLEVFYDGKEIVFCEIASRMGGGRIIQCIENEFGFNPIEELLVAECDPNRIIIKDNLMFTDEYAFILCGVEEGRVKTIPSKLPFDEVFDYYTFATENKEYRAPETVAQNVAAICVKSYKGKELRNKVIEIDNWYKEHCTFEKGKNYE
ncbi:MAG: ATP-grasp domain-containing protein [Pseudobutyrivibrio ruminis]|jgi:biotin carboxylase|uniref:ATP-grasp domain-containing protein n=1 Tax=Pseudobutyrivibrio ruminis TaxID=46206 RepID=UPI0026EB33F4|nr:ATP-grasp domain-containing protein [Pseudobutyrivibrio ruminis]MBE5913079.1 ATP-grasp domain-containing protein [Pseudobutyrivibrio ruminis]